MLVESRTQVLLVRGCINPINLCYCKEKELNKGGNEAGAPICCLAEGKGGAGFSDTQTSCSWTNRIGSSSSSAVATSSPIVNFVRVLLQATGT